MSIAGAARKTWTGGKIAYTASKVVGVVALGYFLKNAAIETVTGDVTERGGEAASLVRSWTDSIENGGSLYDRLTNMFTDRSGNESVSVTPASVPARKASGVLGLVSAGAFSNRENAERRLTQVESQYGGDFRINRITVNGQRLHRVEGQGDCIMLLAEAGGQCRTLDND